MTAAGCLSRALPAFYCEEYCEKTKPSSHTAVFFRPHRHKTTDQKAAPSYPQRCGKHCAVLTTDLIPPIISHFFFFIISDGAPLVENPNPNFARVGRGTPARLGARLKILLGIIHAAARRAQSARCTHVPGHGAAALAPPLLFPPIYNPLRPAPSAAPQKPALCAPLSHAAPYQSHPCAAENGSESPILQANSPADALLRHGSPPMEISRRSILQVSMQNKKAG